MFFYLYTFHTLTGAQSAKSTLSAKGVSAQLIRAPKALSRHGCGYALRVSSSSGLRALSVLQSSGQSFGHLYRFFSNGNYEEVRV